MIRPFTRALLLMAWCLCSCWSSAALAQSPAQSSQPASSADAGAAPEPPPAQPEPSPKVAALRARATEILSLIDGSLDVGAEPATLFSVPLNDEQAIYAEARRLRSIVAAAELADTIAEPDGGSDAGTNQDASDGAQLDAGPDAVSPDGAAPTVATAEPDGDPLDAEYWQARLDLDRASLAFLGLSKTRRAAIVAEHVRRQQAAGDEARKQAEATRKARAAAEERKLALEAARRAVSEAQRRVEQEKARLLGLKTAYSDVEASLLAHDEQLNKGADVRLGWQRRVDEALAELADGTRSRAELATLYDNLAAALSHANGELEKALNALSNLPTQLEPVGDSALDTLDIEVDTREVDELRRELIAQHASLTSFERQIRRRRASALIKEVTSLSEQRLRLLPALPADKYDSLVGFGEVGRSQARFELLKAARILRYHANAFSDWAREATFSQLDNRERTQLIVKLLEGLAALLLFGWWYRRADTVLAEWIVREIQAQKNPRTIVLLRFVRRVRRPLEWLLLFAVLRAFLPAQLAAQLEIQLLSIVLWWVLGEVLVVDVLDAAFISRRPRPPHAATAQERRLRSLHFVGRVAAALGLALSLSVRLVGKGTIHHWVVRLCWLSIVPVAAVLLHWYRPTVVEHFERRKHIGRVAGWISRHKSGPLSYPAVAVGGLYIAYSWTSRRISNYAGRYELVRRLLAYWFRREVTKKEQDDSTGTTAALSALPADPFASLDPDQDGGEFVLSAIDGHITKLTQLISGTKGGVHAVVSERGGGKTTLLKRLEQQPGAIRLSCPHDDLEGFIAQLDAVLGLPAGTTVDDMPDVLKGQSERRIILVDDAHHLIRPVIGGLDHFDRVLRMARESSVTGTLWIVSFDSVIWHYLLRARGARPLFDDVHAIQPWSEENIAALLRRRTQSADLTPTFQRLLTDLPEHADEIEHAEALLRAEHNYYRLLWDYSSGNPGIALHFWRQSLGVDAEGKDTVRLFAPPDISDIEHLPDSTLFVLRTILQVDAATVPDIADATMLSQDNVRDALRYGLGRGYLHHDQNRYRISWNWQRAITNLLRRRHLVLGGQQ